jgi:hypothetical protein
VGAGDPGDGYLRWFDWFERFGLMSLIGVDTCVVGGEIPRINLRTV